MADRNPPRTTTAAHDSEFTSRVAGGTELAWARALRERIHELLERGDRRDQAAEHRDRLAEARESPERDPQPRLDRLLSGRDRDDAACDRADLIDLLGSRDLTSAPGEA